MTTPRNILIGITGGISAYKTPYLIRNLQQHGHIIKAVATENALRFVTPETLETLTGHTVYRDLFAPKTGIDHIELSRWADLLVVAPATANSIAKFANGIADDLLSTLYLTLKCNIVMAPAMNHSMYADDATRRNIHTLRSRGVRFVEPTGGYLACGDIGPGRMAEPDIIAEAASLQLVEQSPLSGRKILITAGATREPIDPVRFISNRSSGKMGYAVAEAFIRYGAHVTLVTGPSHQCPPYRATIIPVTTAAEMFDAVTAHAPHSDIIVKCAAVADYTPPVTSDRKLKKTDDDLTLQLTRTRDILRTLGENKLPGQILIGFAAETDNHLANSVAKLKRKNLDMIVLNDVLAKNTGFASDDNRVMFVRPATSTDHDSGAASIQFREVDDIRIRVEATPVMSKTAIAGLLVHQVLDMMSSHS